MDKNKYPNDLLLYRTKRGLTRKQVCSFLGLKHHGSISRYERGETQPSLVRALRLETLYRTPVAFLYGPLYQRIKNEVRAEEETNRVQQAPSDKSEEKPAA